ncbi:MAG: hypothetical protein RR385_08280 [Clostridiales bacterium]
MEYIDFEEFNGDLSYVKLTIIDLTFHIFIDAASELNKVKEELYFSLYGIKKEFNEFMLKRPDIQYATEPIALKGTEPQIITDLSESAKALGLGPICGYNGIFADLALEAIGDMGRDVMVQCGNSLAFHSHKKRILPIFPNFANPLPWGIKISRGFWGITFGKNTVSLSNTALYSDIATARSDIEMKAGSSFAEIADILRPLKCLRGGAFLYNENTGSWGDISPIVLNKTENKAEE